LTSPPTEGQATRMRTGIQYSKTSSSAGLPYTVCLFRKAKPKKSDKVSPIYRVVNVLTGWLGLTKIG